VALSIFSSVTDAHLEGVAPWRGTNSPGEVERRKSLSSGQSSSFLSPCSRSA
jgi:hypothetical protein